MGFCCKSLQPIGFQPLLSEKCQAEIPQPTWTKWLQLPGSRSCLQSQGVAAADEFGISGIKTSKWLRNVTQWREFLARLARLLQEVSTRSKPESGSALSVLRVCFDDASHQKQAEDLAIIISLYPLPDLARSWSYHIHNCHIISRRMMTFIWALSSSCKIVSLCTTPMYLWATGDVGKT